MVCQALVFVLKSAFANFFRRISIILRFTTYLLSAVIFIGAVSFVNAQDAAADENAKPEPTPQFTENQIKGIQLAESVVLVYSNLRGRVGMSQIRKTGVETGKIELTAPEGTVRKGTYEQRTLRGESLVESKIRLDQSFPNVNYALVYDGSRVFGVFNDSTVFDPRADASSAFSNRVWHGLEALLGYFEMGSKIEYEKDDKVMGVEYSVIKLVDKENRETSYYISKKSYRVMMIEYETGGAKYRRKYYDYKYAQNTLVPYRTVLWSDGKKIEEQTTKTITFGQELGESLFAYNKTP